MNVNQPTYPNTVLNDPLVPGNWQSAVLPDGDYELRLTGVDQCGHQLQRSALITLDNTPPIAQLDSPGPCQHRFGQIAIHGVAFDDNLQRWELAYTGGGNPTWTTIAQGQTPQSGLLATWDVSSLPPCAYTLRLHVVSKSIINNDDADNRSTYVSFSTEPEGLQRVLNVQLP